MVFKNLCSPALIYLIFSITQIVIDTVKGFYNMALMKIWVSFVFTIFLNYLCQSGLGIISWLIVFIPFILMSLIVAILLLVLGLDPTTGKIVDSKHKHHKHVPREDDTHKHHPPEPPDKPIGEEILDYHKPKKHSQNKDSNISNVNKSSDKIIEKSIFFYGEKVANAKNNNNKIEGSNYGKSDEYLDTTNIKDFIESITNILYGMGEQDMAVWWKNASSGCLNAVNGMKVEAKKKAISKCIGDLINELESKFDPADKTQFIKNVKERHCHNNEDFDACKTRQRDKFFN